MRVLLLECSPADKDRLTTELWERGTLGIQETGLPGGLCQLAAFFDEPFEEPAFDEWNPRWEGVEETDWVSLARESWDPVLVGERLYLTPDWRLEPTPPGRVRLEVHPGLASGTGYHPTTQLCLEALERNMRFGDVILDVGTGSGILAQAAALLGAAAPIACDIEPDCAVIAQRNLTRTGIEAGVFAGSPRALKPAVADLVAANLNAETLLSLGGDLVQVVKPGGRLVLGGITARQAPKVTRLFESFGFRSEATYERDNWVCLVLQQPSG